MVQFTGRHPDRWAEQFGLQPATSDIDQVQVYKSTDGRGPALYFMQEDACKWFYELLQVQSHQINNGSSQSSMLCSWQGISPFKDVLPAFGDVFHLASIVGGRAVIDGDPILVERGFILSNWTATMPDFSATQFVVVQPYSVVLRPRDRRPVFQLGGEEQRPDKTCHVCKL